MHNQSQSSFRGSRSSSSSKPSFGGHRPSSGGSYSRGGSSGSRFSGSRRPPQRSGGGGRGNFKQSQFFDLNRFINKAVVVKETEEHFVPEHTFATFEIEESLKKNIIRKGYVLPTPIQDRAIPHVLLGRDVVGIANTGTGKTAAFLIPLVNKVLKNKKERVLIVVPTRELAIQIEDELKGFTPLMGIFSVVCVGGTSIVPQIKALKHINQFVIGTPGRLKDLIERGNLDLKTTNTVVLDEADRMLDMGFIPDMRYLMTKLPKERHTLFFSATMSKDIERLIHEFLREPVSISVKTRDTSQNIDQDVVRLKPGQQKFDALLELLKQPGFGKVLIFGRTKHGVSKLAIALDKEGVKSESIHGNKTHSQRQKALGYFKDGKVQVLVATDVAARGLDIVGVSHVINYELPATYEDYIHRIGRTGRAHASGKALTFIDGK